MLISSQLEIIRMAAKKTSAEKTGTKSDFIRRQPEAMPAAEVVALAKGAGLTIRPGLVYEVRRTLRTKKAASRQKQTQTKIASTTGAPSVSTAPRPIARKASAEDLLRAVAAEIGLGRAIEILTGERAIVRAVMGH